MRPPARLLHVALVLRCTKYSCGGTGRQVVTPARRRVVLGVVLEREIPERDLVGSEAAAGENGRRKPSRREIDSVRRLPRATFRAAGSISRMTTTLVKLLAS